MPTLLTLTSGSVAAVVEEGQDLKSRKVPNELDATRFDVLLEFVTASTQVRGHDALLRVLAERAHWLLEFERLSIVLCDDNREILRIIVIEDHAASEVPAAEIQLSDMDIILLVLTTGVASSGKYETCVPMESAGHLVGVCLAASCEQYTEQEIRLVNCLAGCLAGTFERLAQSSVIGSSLEPTMPAVDGREGPATATHALSLRMSYLAQHDVLTDLPNRLLLNDRLARSLALSSRYERQLAVLFLDLDGFKEINDSLGHAIGDQVLRQISDRLVTCVRSSDTVSRIGGDEFVVLLAELECTEAVAVSAGRIMAAVAAPLQIAGHEIHVAISIGVSIYPGDGDDAETLIKNADTAMYYAKAEGLGKYKFFGEI